MCLGITSCGGTTAPVASDTLTPGTHCGEDPCKSHETCADNPTATDI